jgi:ABC-type transport system involved in cytochrome c biogenesis ATPase subunit/GNAT superfamily N-acetyltransferase
MPTATHTVPDMIRNGVERSVSARTERYETHAVLSSDAKGHARRLTIEGTDKRLVQLRLHRYALVGRGDKITVDPRHPSKIAVPSCEDPSDVIRVTPAFVLQSELRLGAAVYPLRFSEIASEQDLRDYSYLEQFHYKTSPLLRSDTEPERAPTDTGGRKAVIIAHIKNGPQWECVGYIELQMPLLMVKPRHALFDAPFRHPTRPIAWDQWDQTALSNFVNCIVRIARVVTSPEFRGLGLAKLLIQAAKAFSSERWHIKGRRPLFLEISAEMLNYFDFVSSAGLRFVDKTEGNVDRISADLISMQRNPKITSGIMSLQKKYLSNFKSAVGLLGKDFQSALSRLAEICENPELISSLGPEEWFLYRTVFRMPIPYYIAGLDEHSELYLEERLRERREEPRAPAISFATRPVAIDIRGFKATANISVPDNQAVRKIMDCFGIKSETICSVVFGPLDIQAGAGNVIFVAGASGTGKSVLLRSLDPQFAHAQITIERKRSSPPQYTAGWLRDIPSDEPLIQYFSDHYGMERALAALNQAGLSEAFVYLKPFAYLSRGQKYRAKLADLALRPDQVWLIDEFCADLDPLTAKIVSRNLRRHVVKYRRVAFVAAANYRHFIDALAPTRVVILRFGGRSQTLTFKEFLDEFPDTAR